MTVRGGIFVIPLLVSGIYALRYRGGMTQKQGTGITPLTMYLNYNVHHYTLAGCHI
ncbi:MAG: hypothetical protein ACR5K5_01060 [Wolbachia sp.]